ncbi:hypothetical protein D3C72_1739340 [compost metagenome]
MRTSTGPARPQARSQKPGAPSGYTMVTSSRERNLLPIAFSATASPPALGLSRWRYGESWAARLASVKRVPSANTITLVGTSENFAQARLAVSWSWRRNAGLRRSCALPCRFMNGKSSAHHASPITGT